MVTVEGLLELDELELEPEAELSPEPEELELSSPEDDEVWSSDDVV